MPRAIILLVLILLADRWRLAAQHQPVFGEAPGHFSRLNPAALDWSERAHDGLFFTTFFRNQWFDSRQPGAPTTGGAMLSGTDTKRRWGGQFFVDRTGAFTLVEAGGRYAFKVQKRWWFGIQMAALQASLDEKELDLYDADDALVLAAGDEARWGLRGGAGFYYSTHGGFIGGSFQRSYEQGSSGLSTFQNKLHLAGGVLLDDRHWLGLAWQQLGKLPSQWQASWRYVGLPAYLETGLISHLTTTDLGTYATVGGLAGIRQLRLPGFAQKDSYLDLEIATSVPVVSELSRGNLIFDLKVVLHVKK